MKSHMDSNADRSASFYYSILPAVLVASTVIQPKLASVALIVLAIAAAIASRATLEKPRARQFDISAKFALVFCCLAALSAVWSASPLHSLEIGVRTLAICSIALLIPWLMARSSKDHLQRRVHGALAGFTIGAGLLAFGCHTGFPITKAIVTAFPELIETGKGSSYVMGGDGYLEVVPGFFSRSVFVLSIAAWPILFLAWVHTSGWRRVVYLVAPVLFLSLTVPFFGKAAAQIALLVSVAVFLVSLSCMRLGHQLLVVGWTVAVLCAPAVGLLDRMPADVKAGLPQSVESRIAIWGRSASLIAEKPLLGVGADATRSVEKARVERLPKPNTDFSQLKRSDWRYLARRHPHNSFLQVWVELGAVGAILLFAAGIALLQAIRALEPSSRAFAYAFFSAGVVYASVAHSLWQAWFAATLALAFVLFRLGGNSTRSAANSPKSPMERAK